MDQNNFPPALFIHYMTKCHLSPPLKCFKEKKYVNNIFKRVKIKKLHIKIRKIVTKEVLSLKQIASNFN